MEAETIWAPCVFGVLGMLGSAMIVVTDCLASAGGPDENDKPHFDLAGYTRMKYGPLTEFLYNSLLAMRATVSAMRQ